MAFKLLRRKRPTSVAVQGRVEQFHGETIALRPEYDVITSPVDGWVSGIWDTRRNKWIKRWPRPKR